MSKKTTKPSAKSDGPAASRFLYPTLLILCGLLAYSNTFHVPFIFDDQDAIVENTSIRHLSNVRALLHPPSEGVTVQGRPFLNLTLALNYASGGLNVTGYHLINLAIHLLNGLLLFGLVRRVLQYSVFSIQYSVGKTPNNPPSSHADTSTRQYVNTSAAIAFAIAVIWLLHPLNTQAVTYIVQRAESLASCFYLLTLYALSRSAVMDSGPDAETSTRRHVDTFRRPWAAIAILACALGMATKEMMVTAPIAAMLFDRAYLSGSWRELIRRRGWFHLGLMSTWLILPLVLPGLTRDPETGLGSKTSPLHYLYTQAEILTHYLRLAFWPDQLCFDYKWPLVTSIQAVVPQFLLIGILLLLALAAWWKNPRWGFPAVWFFLILAPTSSILPIADRAFEHRMYLPLAGLVVCLVFGAWCLVRSSDLAIDTQNAERKTKNPSPPRRHVDTSIRRYVAIALVAGLALALGCRTWARNTDYRTALGLWEVTIRQRPQNARAVYNRGYIFEQQGRAAEAMRDFNLALTLDPDYAGPYYNRGNLEAAAGQLDQALADYTRAIDLDPRQARFYYNRGQAYMRLGRYPDAMLDYTQTIQTAPDFAQAYYALGNALAQTGAHQQAMQEYTHAIDRDPKLVDAWHNRAAAAVMLGDYDRARADLEQCRRLGSEPSPELVRMLEQAVAPNAQGQR